jgi:hypothetical protein
MMKRRYEEKDSALDSRAHPRYVNSILPIGLIAWDYGAGALRRGRRNLRIDVIVGTETAEAATGAPPRGGNYQRSLALSIDARGARIAYQSITKQL